MLASIGKDLKKTEIGRFIDGVKALYQAPTDLGFKMVVCGQYNLETFLTWMYRQAIDVVANHGGLRLSTRTNDNDVRIYVDHNQPTMFSIHSSDLTCWLVVDHSDWDRINVLIHANKFTDIFHIVTSCMEVASEFKDLSPEDRKTIDETSKWRKVEDTLRKV